MAKGAVLKVLIIRFSSIGDIVLTTPVIRCLKEQLPGVEIHYLTKAAYGQLLTANEHLSKIHTFNTQLSEVLPRLRKEKFDYLIDLHRNLRSLKVRALLGKTAFTFPKLNFRKFLLVHFKIDRLPRLHIVDRYMKAVKSLSVKNDGKGLEFPIAPEDEVDVGKWEAPFKKDYVAWVIGAKHFTKQFPEHKVKEITNELKEPVVLLGGAEDRPMGERIGAEMPHVKNLCGELSIGQSASVVKQAKKVVTNDTGLMHIAAALEKPVVSLWGNTIPEFGMTPYFGSDEKKREALSTIMEVKGLYCRPCSKIGFNKCPEGHFRCMREISNEDIQEAIGDDGEAAKAKSSVD